MVTIWMTGALWLLCICAGSPNAGTAFAGTEISAVSADFDEDGAVDLAAGLFHALPLPAPVTLSGDAIALNILDMSTVDVYDFLHEHATQTAFDSGLGLCSLIERG